MIRRISIVTNITFAVLVFVIPEPNHVQKRFFTGKSMRSEIHHPGAYGRLVVAAMTKCNFAMSSACNADSRTHIPGITICCATTLTKHSTSIVERPYWNNFPLGTISSRILVDKSAPDQTRTA